MKYFSGVFVITAGLLLTACAHNQMAPQQLNNTASLTQVSDAAADQIAEAAASVSQSLTNLEAVERANMAPKAAKEYPSIAAAPIPGNSSIDWNGPIEPLVRQIAKATQYRVKIVGAAPIPPVLVVIHQDQAPNADILRSAALQAGTRATITTNPTTKVIELRYLGR
jgi:defect-in-organelle-trafficking protein DotD